MTILQQVLLAFAAFVLFIFAIRLVFALLLRLQLLPILVRRRPHLSPVGSRTSLCVLRRSGIFWTAGAVLLAPPGGRMGTGTANAVDGRAADQK